MTTEAKPVEEIKALTTIDLQTTLTQLNVIDKGIADLEKKYKGLVADAKTSEGMETLKAARAEIREVRYKVPKIVDSTTKQINKVKKDLQSKGEYIEDALKKIEDPIHKQIKDEEDRLEAIRVEKKQAEDKRLAAIQEKIAVFQNAPVEAIDYCSADIAEAIKALDAIVVDKEIFQEFEPAGQVAKATARAKLQEIHDSKLAAEQEAEKLRLEREEFERLKAEDEKRRLEEQRIEDERRRIEQEEIDRELTEEKEKLRLAQEEQDKKVAAEQEKLRLEREKFEAEQAEAQRLQAEKEEKERLAREEVEREAKEKAAKEAAEAAALRAKEEAEQLQREKEAADLAEKKAKEAEILRKKEEKARKLAEAKCKDASTAFRKILAICESEEHTDTGKVTQIALIAEANI